jgi:NDP-sugar pyrophosphorylase family protein
VEFRNEDSDSHIIDAGIYIFKPSIFKHLTGKSFEKEVLPKLCKTNEVKGYFTHGKYLHLEKN